MPDYFDLLEEVHKGASRVDFHIEDVLNGTVSTEVGAEAECTDHCYTPYSQRPETYIIPVVFAIIYVVGILGNGTLVVIFLRHRGMRNIPNT